MPFKSDDPDFDLFVNTGDVRGLRRSIRGWVANLPDDEQERVRKIVQGEIEEEEEPEEDQIEET